jgi:hypothetical protein
MVRRRYCILRRATRTSTGTGTGVHTDDYTGKTPTSSSRAAARRSSYTAKHSTGSGSSFRKVLKI